MAGKNARLSARLYISHSAEWPWKDPGSCCPHLPASQGVLELMYQHNQEQRQILQVVPGDKSVPALLSLNLVCCHEKPGPMQKLIDSGESKQMEGILAINWVCPLH
jgi:hypothetical protein